MVPPVAPYKLILDLSEPQHITSGGQSMEEMSFVDSINNAENCGFDSGMI